VAREDKFFTANVGVESEDADDIPFSSCLGSRDDVRKKAVWEHIKEQFSGDITRACYLFIPET